MPERFAPGGRYTLTVTLVRPNLGLAGFQLTSRFTDDGAQAGRFAPAAGEDGRVRVEPLHGVEYVNQRKTGTAPSSPGMATWTLVWTAPPARRAVVFHVAANAANGDGTAEGDAIHTVAVESVPSTGR